MMAALSILCASLSSAEAAVALGGGVFGLLPAVTVRAEAPVGETVLALRYDTAAGLVHDVGLAGRMAWHDIEAEFEVAHGFIGLEEIAGIQLDDIPLGQGLTTALTGLWQTTTDGGHHIRLGAGLTARWIAIHTDLGVQTRAFDPSLHHMHAEARVDWRDGIFLRFRAVVPIEAELKVIGFWPQVLVGYTWAL